MRPRQNDVLLFLIASDNTVVSETSNLDDLNKAGLLFSTDRSNERFLG